MNAKIVAGHVNASVTALVGVEIAIETGSATAETEIAVNPIAVIAMVILTLIVTVTATAIATVIVIVIVMQAVVPAAIPSWILGVAVEVRGRVVAGYIVGTVTAARELAAYVCTKGLAVSVRRLVEHAGLEPAGDAALGDLAVALLRLVAATELGVARAFGTVKVENA